MFLEDTEPTVRDEWKFKSMNFDDMSSIRERFFTIDPREKTCNIGHFRKCDDPIFASNFGTAYKFTFNKSIEYLLIIVLWQGFL